MLKLQKLNISENWEMDKKIDQFMDNHIINNFLFTLNIELQGLHCKKYRNRAINSLSWSEAALE